MGFTSGFAGGLTLTTSILYLTLHLHRSNRLYQHTLLREQIDILNSIASANTAEADALRDAIELRNSERRRGVYRTEGEEVQRRPTVTDLLKERWNGELIALVRRTHEIRWEKVWENAGEGWDAAVRFVRKG
ncbi:hypothetical protein FQN54_002117 [Arachnomyces sp. PD_36]|nr:hypothetical protein FQN54_002117 [Arachnomyces sp. PD_36]